MIDIDGELKKIAEVETTNTSHYLVENNSDILIVTFTSATEERYFSFKTSTLKLSQNIPVDILFIRETTERWNWYLIKLVGVGKGVEEIANFLKDKIKPYKKVIFVGISMGGYASILYGSLCKVNHVIAFMPQTDLNYVRKCLPKNREYRRLPKFKDFEQFQNLNKIISPEVQYHISTYREKFKRNMKKNKRWDIAQHCVHHYENINVGKNVNFLGDIKENSPKNMTNLVKDIFVKMNLEQIELVEKTDISYCRIKTNSETLIVSFTSLNPTHRGFERKSSLLNLSRECPIDILYMRDRKHWYIGPLNGIGETIEDTIRFLETECRKYKKVVMVGGSQGGYASILFSSILKTFGCISIIPQTNLHICYKYKPKGRNWRKVSKLESWKKYADLNPYINNETKYYILPGDGKLNSRMRGLRLLNTVEHGIHHFDNISMFLNVNKIENENELSHGEIVIEKLRDIL